MAIVIVKMLKKSSTTSFPDKIDGTNGFPVVENLRRDISRTDLALQEKPAEP